MPEYTVEVTVKVSADTIHEAYGYIREACRWARKAEIIYVDSEVVSETPIEPEAEYRCQCPDDSWDHGANGCSSHDTRAYRRKDAVIRLCGDCRLPGDVSCD